MQLSSTGGRLIISSDGVWDALSAETAFECCRGMPPDAAASQIVKVFIYSFVFYTVIVVYRYLELTYHHMCRKPYR